MHSANLPYGGRVSPGASGTPLHRFLIGCHAEIQKDNSGVVASYIPELKKSDPNHFGISLATIVPHSMVVQTNLQIANGLDGHAGTSPWHRACRPSSLDCAGASNFLL